MPPSSTISYEADQRASQALWELRPNRRRQALARRPAQDVWKRSGAEQLGPCLRLELPAPPQIRSRCPLRQPAFINGKRPSVAGEHTLGSPAANPARAASGYHSEGIRHIPQNKFCDCRPTPIRERTTCPQTHVGRTTHLLAAPCIQTSCLTKSNKLVDGYLIKDSIVGLGTERRLVENCQNSTGACRPTCGRMQVKTSSHRMSPL